MPRRLGFCRRRFLLLRALVGEARVGGVGDVRFREELAATEQAKKWSDRERMNERAKVGGQVDLR
jgi:hypothetical protein